MRDRWVETEIGLHDGSTPHVCTLHGIHIKGKIRTLTSGGQIVCGGYSPMLKELCTRFPLAGIE